MATLQVGLGVYSLEFHGTSIRLDISEIPDGFLGIRWAICLRAENQTFNSGYATAGEYLAENTKLYAPFA